MKNSTKLKAATRRIEREYGLPVGSVRLTVNSGWRQTEDTTLGELKTSWDASRQAPSSFSWPPQCTLTFYTSGGRLLQTDKNRKLDLADRLMAPWNSGNQRTVRFGVSTKNKRWPRWNLDRVLQMERLINYDLDFDGYEVAIRRISKLGIPCTQEFVWKLVIRTLR